MLLELKLMSVLFIYFLYFIDDFKTLLLIQEFKIRFILRQSIKVSIKVQNFLFIVPIMISLVN